MTRAPGVVMLDFIDGLRALKQLGYNPWGPFTQAHVETDSFRDELGTLYHNYWGIKRNARHASFVTLQTQEWLPIVADEAKEAAQIRAARLYGVGDARITGKSAAGGHWIVSLPQDFARFTSVEEAILFYHETINLFYKDAYRFREVPETYFHKLVDTEFDAGIDRYRNDDPADMRTTEAQWATNAKYERILAARYEEVKTDARIVAAISGI